MLTRTFKVEEVREPLGTDALAAGSVENDQVARGEAIGVAEQDLGGIDLVAGSVGA